MKLPFIFFLLLLILSGISLGFSFPYSFGFFPLAFVSLVPLFLFNTEMNNVYKLKGIKRFVGVYFFFLTYNITTTWWIYNASTEGAYMAFFFNSFLMSLPFFLYGYIHKHLGDFKGLVSFVVLWLSFEHIHHIWDLSWPWLTLGNILGNHPMLIQWYEHFGTGGGSLWILLVNLFIFIVIRNVWIKKENLKIQTPYFVLIGLLIIVPTLSSVYRFYNYTEKDDPINVLIVQPNIHPWANKTSFDGFAGEKFTTPVSKQLDKMLYLVNKKINPETDVIICPETAISASIEESIMDNLGVIIKLRQFSEKNNNVPFIIGADTYGKFDSVRPFPAIAKNGYYLENYNTALLLDANNPIEVYHKSKLVLGAEKVPFVDFLPFMAKLSVDLGGTNGILVANKFPKVFNAKGVKYAPLICYESVYGEFVAQFVLNGAEILTVITNDGWWGDTPGYKQHKMLSQIRAIETRRSIARSANTGISCAINQKGEVIKELPWDEAGVISTTLNKNNNITFFTLYGNIIGRISEFIVLGLLLYAFTSMLKNRKIKFN
ncbi:MAG TPA: apolipoprotein N-acyltransferase [Crocinitomix sp.]|nr:apolipoprotein N-acyltransferase [Crocinitomix sp.]